MPLPRVSGLFRVGSDYNLRYAPSGIAVGDFRACGSSSKKLDDGSWQTLAEIWVTVTLFGKAAEHAANLDIVKGAQVDVLGNISIEEWETKEGEKRQTVKVIADAIGVREQRDRDGAAPAQASTQGRADDPNPWGPPAPDADGQPPF